MFCVKFWLGNYIMPSAVLERPGGGKFSEGNRWPGHLRVHGTWWLGVYMCAASAACRVRRSARSQAIRLENRAGMFVLHGNVELDVCRSRSLRVFKRI